MPDLQLHKSSRSDRTDIKHFHSRSLLDFSLLAFLPLSEEERAQDWGREMLIGQSFAKQLELYEAITAFKRAAILILETAARDGVNLPSTTAVSRLIPPSEQDRALEIQYEILLCYYIALKWEDVIFTFENSELKRAGTHFPALHDLLFILYDAYIHMNEEREAQRILQLIHCYFPQETPTLYLSKALLQGDFPVIENIEQELPARPYLTDFLNTYEDQKKSITTAQTLNAFIPGAGYFYLGQRQSGLTALLLNGLFIGASVYFFESGNIPAGIIFTSFEAGWYFGGIYGAGLEAKYYNERLYERIATPMMNRERLFPILMLNYAF